MLHVEISVRRPAGCSDSRAQLSLGAASPCLPSCLQAPARSRVPSLLSLSSQGSRPVRNAQIQLRFKEVMTTCISPRSAEELGEMEAILFWGHCFSLLRGLILRNSRGNGQAGAWANICRRLRAWLSLLDAKISALCSSAVAWLILFAAWYFHTIPTCEPLYPARMPVFTCKPGFDPTLRLDMSGSCTTKRSR